MLANAILNGTQLVVQIFHNRNSAPDIAFWARATKDTISIATRSVIGEELTFVGTHDADLRVISRI
jgi:hypothetical protein